MATASRARSGWVLASVAVLAVTTAAVTACTQQRGQQDGAVPGGVLTHDVPDERDTAGAVARGEWRRLPASPVGARLGPVLVWDGKELLQIGGVTGQVPGPNGSTVDGAARTDAVAYAPDTGRWRRLDAAPFPVASGQATAVWTGRELFVLTSRGAALLEPISGRWRPTAAAPFTGRDDGSGVPLAAWNGGEVVITSAPYGSSRPIQVAEYDPDTDRWTRTDPPQLQGHDPLGAATVATPDGLVLFSLWEHAQTVPLAGGGTMTTGTSGVDTLRLSPQGRWTTLAADWPQHKTVSSPVLTDLGIIVPAGQEWCGGCSHPPPHDEHGYLADAHTLRGRAMTRGPLDDTGPIPVWTGRALITLAQAETGGPGGSIKPGDPAVWTPPPTAGHERHPHPTAWTTAPPPSGAPTSSSPSTPPVTTSPSRPRRPPPSPRRQRRHRDLVVPVRPAASVAAALTRVAPPLTTAPSPEP